MTQNHLLTAGFFPGLGSRTSYKNLGTDLLDSDIPEVVAIYRAGAGALGFAERPERLTMAADHLPEGRLARQALVGAALTVHNLALDAHLRAEAVRRGVNLEFGAYAGESLGMVGAAVAAGSLSVADGVLIAHAFTPLSLVGAEGLDSDEPIGRSMSGYLRGFALGQRLVAEPFHVLALRGGAGELAGVLGLVAQAFSRTDVEVHKLYSARQTNLYVRGGIRACFDEFLGQFPAVEVQELKEPTTFLAHSGRMSAVREALARFIADRGIVFREPRVPVVANNTAGLLTTGAGVRDAILAMTDEVMASRATAEALDVLGPDLILEMGLGGKSVRLLRDNDVRSPVAAYTGDRAEADALLGPMKLVDDLAAQLARLRRGDPPAPDHHDLLREIFREAAAGPFARRFVARAMTRLAQDRRAAETPASARLLETVQHTYYHRDYVDTAGGELVLRARLKKRLLGPPERLGQAYTELTVLGPDGVAADRSVLTGDLAEAVVFHFSLPADLDPAGLELERHLLPDLEAAGIDRERPEIVHLVHQYALFQDLRRHRPAVFAQNDCYLEGSDAMGWLAALAASGAAPLADAVRLYRAHLDADAGSALAQALSTLNDSALPVISPEGNPLWLKKDLEFVTRAIFD
jgi:hypothetical protein